MSKPLAISAAFSVFAMAAFALLAAPIAGPEAPSGLATMQTGAAANATAPAIVDQVFPALSGLIR